MAEETSLSQNSPQGEGSSPPPQPQAQPSAPPLVKPTLDLNYMHRPPRIVPNYGKKQRGILPKSSVSRVLLYDNVTQQQMLDVRMTHLRAEQHRTGRLLDLHRKSFIIRRLQKQKHEADMIHHLNYALPLLTITTKTTGTGKTRGKRRRAKKQASENAPEGTEVLERHVTMKSVEEAGADRGGDVTLPSLPHQRHGASTSHGFALHTPLHRGGGKRGTHTATMMHGESIGHDLPELVSGTSGRVDKVLLHMDSDARGLTRMMHTFQQAASWEGGENRGKGRAEKTGGRTTEDERYRMLEELLVRIEPPNDGYLELSPSFHSPRQTMTFTRPSSLHSSITPRPIAIHSWLSSVL